MKTQFSFLTSNAFWSNVITSASVTLIDPNFPTQAWYVTLGKFLGILSAAFTVVRTLDRSADKKVEAAEVASIDIKKKKKV